MRNLYLQYFVIALIFGQERLLKMQSLDANTNFVNPGIVKEMAKSARKKPKGTTPVKKTKKKGKAAKGQTKAAEYVSYLLELHKLQGALLSHLKKEV